MSRQFKIRGRPLCGLRRTIEDKRHAITVALGQFSHLSDRMLTDLCGVSHASVAAVRSQLANLASCERRLASGSPFFGIILNLFQHKLDPVGELGFAVGQCPQYGIRILDVTPGIAEQELNGHPVTGTSAESRRIDL